MGWSFAAPATVDQVPLGEIVFLRVARGLEHEGGLDLGFVGADGAVERERGRFEPLPDHALHVGDRRALVNGGGIRRGIGAQERSGD
jgi:hypothetical protein